MTFSKRHIGITGSQEVSMLKKLGFSSTESLSKKIIPSSIFFNEKLNLEKALSEHDAEVLIKAILDKNKLFKSFIGMG